MYLTSALQQYCLHHCGCAPGQQEDVTGIGVDHVSAWKLEKFIVMIWGMAGVQIQRKWHPASPTRTSPRKHIRCGKMARPGEVHSGSWWGKWRALLTWKQCDYLAVLSYTVDVPWVLPVFTAVVYFCDWLQWFDDNGLLHTSSVVETHQSRQQHYFTSFCFSRGLVV